MQDRFHQVETLKQLTKRGWLAPLLNLNRAGTVFLRTSYIGICMHTGLFDALKQRPMRADELAGPLGIDPQMADQLVEWLSAGVQLGVLGERNGRYRIRSREVRRLLRPGLAPIAAFYEELVYVELPVLLDTPRSLRSGKLFEVADADPAVVARASRLSEPFISSALLSVVEPTGPCRVLEIGCGTGGNILAAAALNPDLTVVGIDLDADVANLAKANIAEAGLASRVEIEVGDALERPAQADFDPGHPAPEHLLLRRGRPGRRARQAGQTSQAGRPTAGDDHGARVRAAVWRSEPVGRHDEGRQPAAIARRTGGRPEGRRVP